MFENRTEDSLLPRRTARDLRVHRREFDGPAALIGSIRDLSVDVSDELRRSSLVGSGSLTSRSRSESGEVGLVVRTSSAGGSGLGGHWRRDHGRGTGGKRRAVGLRCCVSSENGSLGVGIGMLPGRRRRGILGVAISISTSPAIDGEMAKRPGMVVLTSFMLRGEYIG